jgi:uncharacterized protein (DUF1697 family)
MTHYVALFRGINVGKAKRIAMADLRALLEGLGYRNVRTLLNSGNALFSAPTVPAHKLAARIHAAVAKQLGVEAQVIVKTADEIAGMVRGNRLDALCSDDSRLLVAMTGDVKALLALRRLARKDWGEERIHVGKQAAYLWCARGILESAALAALHGELAGVATTRNWATLRKIHALLSAGDRR